MRTRAGWLATPWPSPAPTACPTGRCVISSTGCSSTISARSASPTASCSSPAASAWTNGRSCAPIPSWDGTGYPSALKGELIPLGARVFAVADAFDAMTCDRPYSVAIPFEAARVEIERSAGTHFDPGVVQAFLRVPLELLESIRNGSLDPTQATAGNSLTREH